MRLRGRAEPPMRIPLSVLYPKHPFNPRESVHPFVMDPGSLCAPAYGGGHRASRRCPFFFYSWRGSGLRRMMSTSNPCARYRADRSTRNGGARSTGSGAANKAHDLAGALGDIRHIRGQDAAAIPPARVEVAQTIVFTAIGNTNGAVRHA